MGYTLEDAMRDEGFEAISRELYPEHRNQAIEEFTSERLRSFYLRYPDVAVKGVSAFKDAKALLESGHPTASVVFAVTSIEQFLKVALLKPVVFGLIHVDSLASLVVDVAMDQTGGLDRYKSLLAGLFNELAGIDVSKEHREGASKTLLVEIRELQELRNKIVHRAEKAEESDAKHALAVANGVYSQVFVQLLHAIGLQVEKGARIALAQ